MNKTMLIEWLKKSYHNLTAAKLLLEAKHYTDTIEIELHYAVEKMLKSFLAYENKQIPKIHNLVEIHAFISDKIEFSKDELSLLEKISSYHIDESYPATERVFLSHKELENEIEFAYSLFDKICNIFNVSIDEIK